MSMSCIKKFPIIFILIIQLLWMYKGIPQQLKGKDQYLLGPEQQLQIMVHIWGEVNKPGDYLVPDGTTVLELISTSGGPTEYADLKHVQLSRMSDEFHITPETLIDLVEQANRQKISKETLEKSLHERYSARILEINITKYLNDPENITYLPNLMPGDVIIVKKNMWHKWRTLVRVASEVAIIASVYVWYLRAEHW